MAGWLLIIVLLLLGGTLSTLGDLLGSRIGKARLSVFKLRHRRTAVLITILTGSDTRHQFFTQYLNYHFSISEIYIEKSHYPNPLPQSEKELIAWDWFFKRRERYEKKLLIESEKLTPKNKPQITHLEHEDLNTSSTIAKIEKNNPCFIAIFGTGILRKPFLKKFSDRLYNLHINANLLLSDAGAAMKFEFCMLKNTAQADF